jgi:predicted transcriptional regulator
MKKTAAKAKKLILRSEAQRKAFSSPLRLELIGLFTDGEPRSAADMAELVGRPASAIHYHVRVLEKAGLLKRSGERHSARKPEALYLPTADVFQMEQPKSNPADAADAAVKTLSTAFRMAERDMKVAMTDPRTRPNGPHRNAFGARLHCRLTKKELAELNRHLRTIEKMLVRSTQSRRPSPDDQFVSLTLALMPLRNRKVKP